jgi:hypothetical protein
MVFVVNVEAGDEVICYLTCEEVVGTTVVKSLKVL